MKRPTLAELPPPPPERRGWPWTEESPRLPPDLERPRISIVIATYRQAEFIEETIRSVLLQGYPDLELLVLDGASDDGTVPLLERYEPWLTAWESAPDRGQYHAVNKGFARATGEILTFLSSDDVYQPGTLADVAAHWPRLAPPPGGEGYGAVVGGFRHIDERSEPWGPEPIPARLPHEGPLDLTLVDPEAWRLHQESTFYARHALDAIGRQVREDCGLHGDRELLIRLLRRFPVVLSARCYSAFRWHAASSTTGADARYAGQLAYARLFDSFAAVRDRHQRRRRRIARRYHAKALLTLARYCGVRRRAAAALGRALFHQPSLICKRRYVRAWLEVAGALARFRQLKTFLA